MNGLTLQMITSSNTSLPPIVMIGGNSLLARSIYSYFYASFNFIFISRSPSSYYPRNTHLSCDYLSLNQLDNLVLSLRPNLIINCAAITSVEQCESNPHLAHAVNVDLSRKLAHVCSLYDIDYVHISTDHVFNGLSGNYTEMSYASPVNTYGLTKLQAENIVLLSNPRSLVLRTNFFSWGPLYRPSFSDTILAHLRQRNEIHLFADAIFSPVTAYTLFRTLIAAVNHRLTGIYHLSSDDSISKYEFGLLLAARFSLDPSFISKSRLSERSDLVPRPRNLSLSNTKLASVLNLTIGSVDDQVCELISTQNLSSRV